jgi:hypothetical protein
MNKAPIGPYLAEVGQAADDRCWWCSNASQTREHLFKHCNRWKEQQSTMWREVKKATGGKRTARNTSMAQLFGDERCTAAILDFLRTTDVGVRRGGTERRSSLEVGEDDEEDGGAEWTEDEDEGEAQSGGEWSEDEGG